MIFHPPSVSILHRAAGFNPHAAFTVFDIRNLQLKEGNRHLHQWIKNKKESPRAGKARELDRVL
jgi:hypothetical protein